MNPKQTTTSVSEQIIKSISLLLLMLVGLFPRALGFKRAVAAFSQVLR
jgi:hypothetical protein